MTTYSSTGYPIIWQPKHPRAHCGYVFEHILIAEKVLGHYLPEKAVLHHHDEDPANNANSNLVICENQAYHILLHQMLRVLKAAGDPNTQRSCYYCKKLKPNSMFSGKTGGLCDSCRKPRRFYSGKLQRNNRSGYVGVSWVERESKWRAFIGIKGRFKSLGEFTSKDDAIAARLKAEREIQQ